ncbi:FAD-binding oxidoreductase [Beijerinckia indica]|uniref:FAD linked oxidase domain protein n=1 Tax=Beijerinckia indica subsp. indica (strain ATCC 9039 / DSM 1715 / NCIMB 8712) TaxID=395963 RepID=B2IF73_BEII9|nr:FAD-binding oxidoreductase [Beijerinckia indica]ACB95638.1 FAD linked oxidase domain protein [Beijerinckia indica subsp. indica ATCC 9039]
MDTQSFSGEDLLSRLRLVLGEKHVLTEGVDMAAFLEEPRGLYHGHALAVVRPGSTQEVASVMTLCAEAQTNVVTQGGNTGLVGGQIPLAGTKPIVLSLTRLNQLREIDLPSETMTVEAGMTLAAVQAAADTVERLFPLSLASEGSCTIGGNLATNAGGTNVIAYGNARALVLGLEVVLADGRILHDLSKLKKDNTGYDLKDLFIGSEGTLGIITAAVLKLFPKPRSRETAFIGLSSPRAAVDFLTLARAEAGPNIVAFELIPRIGIDFVLAHSEGNRDPFNKQHAWYVLLELASPQKQGLDTILLHVLEAGMEKGLIEDAAIAASLAQHEAFWRLRELLSEVQGREGGSIKHDVSVPIAAVPDFLDDVANTLAKALPGSRPVPFGHLGDGNIHCNISQPIGADKQAFLDRWDEVNTLVHGLVAKYHGSISAEHGIGQLKRKLLPQVKDPVALDVMRAVKTALDPQNLLNPGKVL